MPSFESLVSGYRVFKATIFAEKKDLITHLIMQGARASTLVITSSGLRIAPDTIFSCNPGDLYVVRNLAGMVPPYTLSGANGTIAAIEHAVVNINVQNIIVLGHAHCEGIKELLTTDISQSNIASDENQNNIEAWLSIAREAKEIVLSDIPIEEQEKACEEESLLISLRNLISYPFIEQKIENNEIDIWAMHFDIESGELKSFNPESKFFELVE